MANWARLVAIALLAMVVFGPPAGASEGKGKGAGETYAKLAPVVVEMWDSDGLFHTVSMELVAVFPAQGKVNKSINIKIQQALQSVPYAELTKPTTGTQLIKATALRVIREDPEGETASDVLIKKLMFN